MMTSAAEVKSGPDTSGEQPPLQRRRQPVVAPGIDLSSLEVGRALQGTIVSDFEGKRGRKVWVESGITRVGRGGRVHRVRAMVCLNEEKDKARAAAAAVGQQVTVYISKVETESARLRARLTPVTVKPRPPKRDPATLLPIESMTVGQRLRGTIVSLFGDAAFVDVGASRAGRKGARVAQNAILRKWDVPPDVAFDSQLVLRQDQTTVLTVGAVVDVYVKEIFRGTTTFLSLTMDPTITPEKAAEMRRERLSRRRRETRRVAPEELEIGSRRPGVVADVRSFGLLVDVGARRNGLAPVSDVGRYLGLGGETVDLRRHFAQGDGVVVDVQAVENGRIALKLVARRNRPPQELGLVPPYPAGSRAAKMGARRPQATSAPAAAPSNAAGRFEEARALPKERWEVEAALGSGSREDQEEGEEGGDDGDYDDEEEDESEAPDADSFDLSHLDDF